MPLGLVKKIFGTKNSRSIKRLTNKLQKINDFGEKITSLSNDELRKSSLSIKERYKTNTKNRDNLLFESFAICREMSGRILNMRHFDEQILGALILDGGNVAEMKTGEGKTLAATLSVHFNALISGTVHVITANDYLAHRDAEEMKPLYEALGLTVSSITSNLQGPTRQNAHGCNIVYGTAQEFAFDYLRDHMSYAKEDTMFMNNKVEMSYCIIDEADAILIDEARTPFIISIPTEVDHELVKIIDEISEKFKVKVYPNNEARDNDIKRLNYDAVLTESQREYELTEKGHSFMEKLLIERNLITTHQSLYTNQHVKLVHMIANSLRGRYFYNKGVDYLVKDGEVLIINSQTGRVETGKRWSEGLHQAIEAKEKLEIQADNETGGSITLQNYFKLYKKSSGMTGTADTEAYEFMNMYGMDVIIVPTHKTMIRTDTSDIIFSSKDSKYNAIVKDIQDKIGKGRPILVGTLSVNQSEEISKRLDEVGIAYQLLNAKNHEKEALIIANAGRPGVVTIATNMAGRGTDIILGGKITEESSDYDIELFREQRNSVIKAGGLHIIGVERNDSRRIDLQLIGRAGRQGDPGSSAFYISMEDRVLYLNGGEKFVKWFEMLGLKGEDSLSHPMIDKAIRDSQRKIESVGYDQRLTIVKYDNTVNIQRGIVYDIRDEWMESELTLDDAIEELIEGFTSVINEYLPIGSTDEEWNIDGLKHYVVNVMKIELGSLMTLDLDIRETVGDSGVHTQIINEYNLALMHYISLLGESNSIDAIKSVFLLVLDNQWRDQIKTLDSLRDGIGLRGYGNKNPEQEFKREAITLFEEFLYEVKTNYSSQVIANLHQIQFENDMTNQQLITA